MQKLSLALRIISKALSRLVSPGEFAEVGVDLVLGHDVSTPLAIKVMEDITDAVWDRHKIAIVMDHFVPAPTANAAQQHKLLREWVGTQGINSFFDVGRGVCHQVILEEGLISPGLIVAGADSHTCSCGAFGALGVSVGSTELGVIMATGKMWIMVPETIRVKLLGRLPSWSTGKDLALHLLQILTSYNPDYKVVEFAGEGVTNLTLSDRITISNMMAESGAKTAIFEPDEQVYFYLKDKNDKYEPIYSDGKAEETLEIDLGRIKPMVAVPYSPNNVKPADSLGVIIDQAYLGSCTNGRLEDLRAVAAILKGRRVHPRVRFLISPASRQVFQEALHEGIIDVLVEAGAQFVGWSCGACFGGHLGLLADGERCISSTNRNFLARMGSASSEVYLASPNTVAASAVFGKIVDPRCFA